MTKVNKLLGVLQNDEIVYINSFHENGVSLIFFTAIDQKYIDEENENIADQYGYLWQEAVAEGSTTDSLDDFLESLVAQNEAYGYYFLGHDNTYTEIIDDTDKTLIECETDLEIETFNCTGSGTFSYTGFSKWDFAGLKFKTIFDSDLYKTALSKSKPGVK